MKQQTNNKIKLVTCSSCLKEKYNSGYNMCSACLRNWKRKNKAEFYLGTCYSEITRRTKTFLKTHPNYYGLPKCTREEFINKFKNDSNFLNQWKKWKDSGFKRGSAPSIDRIDSSIGYLIDNLQFLSNIENARKEFGFKIEVTNGIEILKFDSIVLGGKYFNVHPSSFWYHAKKGKWKEWKITILY